MANSIKIDAREVLLYLNQLGYTNISAQTLKEFLTDLKKLIKSSTRDQILNSDILLNDYSSIRHDSIWRTPLSRHKSNPKKQLNSVEESVEEKREYIPNKEMRHISLHVMRTINKEHHKHCIHVNDTTESESKSKIGESKSACNCTTTESSSKTTVPTSKDSKRCSSVRQRGGSAKSVKTVNRKDPVALYHYYQSEWKKVKFPGEEEHAILRRTIRKKLSDPNFKKP